jgi:peptidoglycan/xylan/chitin deacetylase (PgdA/CDA1 family)
MTFRESGKLKAVTFSFDDGVLQDIRLIELLNKYGLKATFNLNSELFGGQNILRFEDYRPHVVHRYVIASKDVKEVYAGHEVAAHTLTHPKLTTVEDDNEIIRQVEQDRLNLSELVGYEVVGFAYPGGGVNHDDRCAELIRKHTGVRYARGYKRCESFDMPDDLYQFSPNASADHLDALEGLVDRFLELRPDKPQMLHVVGHAYGLDYENDRWIKLEAILEKLSGLDDVFYGTSKEVLL